MDEETPSEEPTIESLQQEGVELSLDQLGRAYAKAVGLVDETQEPVQAKKQPVSIDDDAACELSPKSILEAILFVGSADNEPFTSRQIAALMRDVSAKEVASLAKELQLEYEQTGSAYRIERDKNKIRMVLAEPFHVVRENFYGEVRHAKLSQQAIDVLAIVAYNQPVTRDHVSKLRGRDCGAILKQMVKRDLLVDQSTKENARIKEYRTTDRFLELFGLETIADLPQSDDASTPDIE